MCIVRRNPLLFISFGLFVLFGIMHFLAGVFYFYWTLWWFDVLMHFFGGLSLGMFLVWLLYLSRNALVLLPPRRRAMLTVAVIVLVIGAGWEVFEYANGLTQSTESYPLDVLTDIAADVLGALLGGFIATTKRFYE